MQHFNDYNAFFEKATGKFPYPYQVSIANGVEFPNVLQIPTGLGKTAGAMLGWLWRRRFAPLEVRQRTPRRLVYCLPARVLVEQTRDEAVRWLNNLGVLNGSVEFVENGSIGSYDPWGSSGAVDGIRVHLLMGGEHDRDWDWWPERDAILVGTQDMLLSRALNRGYAISRYRWPSAFGLLHNDCQWVLDEVQLMGPGLSTATQLQAFRRKLGTLSTVGTLWMSATLDPQWLQTTDFSPELDASTLLALRPEDKALAGVAGKLEARKELHLAEQLEDKKEAARILENHSPGSLTLVVVNTVRRAQQVFDGLVKSRPAARLVLVHSQFRESDRRARMAELLAPPGESGTIAVSTQVVEAGVNVSSRCLITDLAPWSSLVQRFGRCNRFGEFEAGQVWVLNPENPAKSEPYSGADLARSLLRIRDYHSVARRAR